MSEVASPTGLSKTSMVVPIANVSSLSQAWLDALGLTRHQAVAPAQKTLTGTIPAKPTMRFDQSGRANRLQGFGAVRQSVMERGRTTGHRMLASRERLLNLDRVRYGRASKKVASVHPPQPDVFRRSAGRITIISRRGVVRLLLQRDATQLRITAVCDPRMMAVMDDALRATRTAFAARGVQVQSRTYGEVLS